ncbi:MAG: type II CAAX endopeptidase family protein [Candidatus Acidiferrum sp.]
MDGDPFGTPPEARGEIQFSAGGFTPRAFPNKTLPGAAWRLLTYFAIFFVLWSVSLFILGQLLRPVRGVFSPSYELYGELVGFLAAFFSAWIMAHLEERSLGAYGLPVRGAFGKLFTQGCLLGLCQLSALVGVIAVFGGYSFGGLVEHGAAMAKWALYWSIFFVVVGLFEEFFFRGYTLYTLAEGIGFWPAAVLLSLAFGAFHIRNSGEGWAGIASVVFIGIFWSFTLKRTGSLWLALGMHAAFDFGETFLFSVPDSGIIFPGHLSSATLQGPQWLTGGSAGPEASLFDFVIVVILFFIVHLLYPAKQTQQSGAATS